MTSATIKDALNRLFKVYFDIENHDCWEYSLYKNKYFPNIEVIDEIKQKILNVSRENYYDFSDFISLIFLEYYLILKFYNSYVYKNKNEKLLNNEIIFNMINQSKEEFIDSIYLDENNYLIQAIFKIITEYKPNKYIDEYCYNPTLKDELLQKNSYLLKKYHPNLRDEKNEMKLFNIINNGIYRLQNYLNINKLSIFIYYAIMMKQLLDNSDDYLFYIREKYIGLSDEVRCEIDLFLTKYFYVCACSRIKELNIDDQIYFKQIENLVLENKKLDLTNQDASIMAKLIVNFYNTDVFEYQEKLDSLISCGNELIKKI